MFDDYSLDPRSMLALLCLFTAFAFWNNDMLFFLLRRWRPARASSSRARTRS